MGVARRRSRAPCNTLSGTSTLSKAEMLLSVYTYLNLMSNFIDRLKLLFQTDKEFRTALYNIMGFYPHDVEIYRIAFAHKSQEYKSKRSGDRPVNNERLEFLGDAVLETVVSDIVYRRFKNKREGFLTNTRSKIVSRESLGRIAKEIGLERLIQSHTYSRSHNSFIAGNAFEALMGAIYLDRGFEYAFRFIEKRIFEKQINLESVAQKEVNFKSKLLEYCQKNRLKINFNDKNEGEKGKNPSFVTSIIIEGLFTADGKGYSKKEAHQNAAREALLRMRREPNFEDSIYRAKEGRTAMEADPCFVLPIIDEIEADIAREKEEGDKTAREQRNNESKSTENRRAVNKNERKAKENTADNPENLNEGKTGETVKAEEKKAQKNTKKGKTAKAESPEDTASEGKEEKPEKNQKQEKSAKTEKPVKNERQEKKEKPAKPETRTAAQATVAKDAVAEEKTKEVVEKNENSNNDRELMAAETTEKAKETTQSDELPTAEPTTETGGATETAEAMQVTEETSDVEADRKEDNTENESDNNAGTTTDAAEALAYQSEAEEKEESSEATEDEFQTGADHTDNPAEESESPETASQLPEDTATITDESIAAEGIEEVPAVADATEETGTTEADATEEKETAPAEIQQPEKDGKTTDTTTSQQKEAAVFARAAAFMANAYADASRKPAEDTATSSANATSTHEVETDDVLPISMEPDPNGIARPVLKERPKVPVQEVEVMPMEIIFDDFSAPLSEFTSSQALHEAHTPAEKTEEETDVIEISFEDEVQHNDARTDIIQEPSATHVEESGLPEVSTRKPRRAHGRKQNATAFTNTDIILAETSHRAEKARKKVEEARKEKARKRAHKELKEATRGIFEETAEGTPATETAGNKRKATGKSTRTSSQQSATEQVGEKESLA